MYLKLVEFILNCANTHTFMHSFIFQSLAHGKEKIERSQTINVKLQIAKQLSAHFIRLVKQPSNIQDLRNAYDTENARSPYGF